MTIGSVCARQSDNQAKSNRAITHLRIMGTKVRISDKKTKRFLSFLEREFATPHSKPLGKRTFEQSSSLLLYAKVGLLGFDLLKHLGFLGVREGGTGFGLLAISF